MFATYVKYNYFLNVLIIHYDYPCNRQLTPSRVNCMKKSLGFEVLLR